MDCYSWVNTISTNSTEGTQRGTGQNPQCIYTLCERSSTAEHGVVAQCRVNIVPVSETLACCWFGAGCSAHWPRSRRSLTGHSRSSGWPNRQLAPWLNMLNGGQVIREAYSANPAARTVCVSIRWANVTAIDPTLVGFWIGQIIYFTSYLQNFIFSHSIPQAKYLLHFLRNKVSFSV